ncbi:MAG: hypothetical protein JXA89_21435 [Anaerolineae bacterium]|nr:hypothetical protein [Anaerolineae bacterium]
MPLPNLNVIANHQLNQQTRHLPDAKSHPPPCNPDRAEAPLIYVQTVEKRNHPLCAPIGRILYLRLRISSQTRIDPLYRLGSLPVTEGIQEKTPTIPWFKRYRPSIIEEYAAAFRKVVEHHKELLTNDPGDPPEMGSWGLTRRRGG